MVGGWSGELATSKDKLALATSLRELKGEPTRAGHIHGKDTRFHVRLQRPRVIVICFQYFSPVRPLRSERSPLYRPTTFHLDETVHYEQIVTSNKSHS